MSTTGAEDDGNPIAEKRRQRKLENQRLEAAAKQRQQDLQLAKERELQRLEDERVAAEQRRLDDINAQRQRRHAELERIAGIERAEQDVVLSIERKLKSIGAFCTREINLPSTALPQCCAVLSPSSLEEPIAGVDENLVFVGDSSSSLVSVYRLCDGKCLFKIVIQYTMAGSADVANGVVDMSKITSMCATRSGHLIVCSQELGAIGAFDINQLMTLRHPVSETLQNGHHPVVEGFTALIGTFSFPTPPSTSQGKPSCTQSVCVDDTASELYVSDELRHSVHVLRMNSSTFQLEIRGSKSNPPISFVRTFGAKGHGRGQLHKPCGVDVSHYHALVCDRGNNRIAAFTKRGEFVCALGTKGSQPGQFIDPRDVKLTNVRKRAISRGLFSDESTISNEQFDVIVADLGNFRVQILAETGGPVRVLSMLSGPEQISFHQNLISASYSQLLQHYASIDIRIPSLAGVSLLPFFSLAERIHPSCPVYQKITQHAMAIRSNSARFHHPTRLALSPKDRDVIVLDRQNAKIVVYSLEGSRSKWADLPSPVGSSVEGEQQGLNSAHSSLVEKDRMYVSDPISHRIAVLAFPSLGFLSYIGASTHGDQTRCSEGFVSGELRFPSFLAIYRDQDQQLHLLVSDTGNHSISIFDPETGRHIRRIGGGFGHLDGYFDSPQGIAVGGNRWLYVCDQRNHRVQVFDLVTMRFSRKIGTEQGTKPGEFSFPSCIAVCKALSQVPDCDFGPFRNAKVCVGDSGNHRVQVFDVETNSLLFVVDTSHTPFEQLLLPTAIVIQERSSHILVVDSNNRCVAIFRNDGKFVAAFGSNLEPNNCFQRPNSILILYGDERQDGEMRVVVTDAARMALCSFQLQES